MEEEEEHVDKKAQTVARRADVVATYDELTRDDQLNFMSTTKPQFENQVTAEPQRIFSDAQ